MPTAPIERAAARAQDDARGEDDEGHELDVRNQGQAQAGHHDGGEECGEESELFGFGHAGGAGRRGRPLDRARSAGNP